MADAILGVDRPARKHALNDIPQTRPVTGLEGLVADPHLDLDSQVAILAAVDETGSASLGDLIALLPDHPSPGQAITALIREEALVITSSGLIDAHSQVARRSSPPLRETLAATPQSPKKGVQHLRIVSPEPDIFFASGIDRSYFVKEPRLRQKGIYLALYGSAVYVGRSGDTACRIAWGAHLRRAARYLAIYSKMSLGHLNNNDSRGAKSSTFRPRATPQRTYSSPSARVKASSCTRVAPASCM